MITTSEIASVTGGVLTGPGDLVVTDILIDSRRSSAISEGSVFIAIAGPANDGHEFITSLYRSGIRAFITEKDLPGETMTLLSGSAVIKTDNSILALHKIARFIRDRFNGEVIAITGSTGKTIVKEWLSDILSIYSPTVRSPRSYNSQTGVPLSLWRLNNRYRYAVVEAGMSKPGEIARLERIISPSTGLFTNIGEAHQENFGSLEEKAAEKLLLFKNCTTIVYCAGHEIVKGAIENDQNLIGKNLFSWSSSHEISANLYVIPQKRIGNNTLVEIISGGEKIDCVIPFIDRASVENASAVIAVIASMKLSLQKAAEGIERLEAVAMRMEKKEGINGCMLIEDYYNSDPGSLGMALDHLKEMPFSKKTVIISDFIQSGRDAEELGSEILQLSERAGVTRFICVGEQLSSTRHIFPAGTVFFDKTGDLLEWFKPEHFSREAILLKGARIFRFEEISHMLEHQVHTTRLEINLNAVLANLNFLRSKLNKGTKIMAMIKAFAYGAGPRDIAGWLNYNGIDFLTVAYTDEGVSLRREGVANRIMVMSPDASSFRMMIEHDLEPELFSIGIMKTFIAEAERNGLSDYPVHIKLDTGMHRLGLEEADLPAAIDLIKGSSSIKVASVFSHLGSSESNRHDELTLLQAALFERMTGTISEAMGSNWLKHLLNSSGIERFPQYQYDMVRIGIGLYYNENNNSSDPETAVQFKTTVTQVKKVSPGDGVGYGFTDSSARERTIAVVPVGYADGLMRMMGQARVRMYVNGSYVNTVGRICMDMCMLDVTGVDVVPGDEVEIFGNHVSISELADRCDTIPHEILTGIHPRVRRVFIYD